jgi:hypothetical protein
MNIHPFVSNTIPSMSKKTTSFDEQRNGGEIQHSFVFPKKFQIPRLEVADLQGFAVEEQLPEDLKNPNNLSQNMQQLAEYTFKLLAIVPEYFASSKMPKAFNEDEAYHFIETYLDKHEKGLFPATHASLGKSSSWISGARLDVGKAFTKEEKANQLRLPPDDPFSHLFVRMRSRKPASLNDQSMENCLDLNVEFSEYLTHPEVDGVNIAIQTSETPVSDYALEVLDASFKGIKPLMP